MLYEIKIFYHTGDSFGSEDTVDSVGCSWENLDKAKEALQSICEHYRILQEFESLAYADQAPFIANIKQKKWFDVGADMDDDTFQEWLWRHCLQVERDDGTMQRISAFWCGYFERMYSAEIVANGDTDMKVSF